MMLPLLLDVRTLLDAFNVFELVLCGAAAALLVVRRVLRWYEASKTKGEVEAVTAGRNELIEQRDKLLEQLRLARFDLNVMENERDMAEAKRRTLSDDVLQLRQDLERDRSELRAVTLDRNDLRRLLDKETAQALKLTVTVDRLHAEHRERTQRVEVLEEELRQRDEQISRIGRKQLELVRELGVSVSAPAPAAPVADPLYEESDQPQTGRCAPLKDLSFESAWADPECRAALEHLQKRDEERAAAEKRCQRYERGKQCTLNAGHAVSCVVEPDPKPLGQGPVGGLTPGPEGGVTS